MSRYAAFISYSHADTPTVRWLHHALETFRVPKALVGTPTPLGPAPRRLAPIFRDRDELPASGDLGTELRAALSDAAFLIVICSPRSAQSHWVNEEILAFKRLHGDGRVLALIASGEPYSADTECFPPALRFRMGPGGVLTTEAAEPIAADIRPGKDGKRLAHLKLIAGLTGLKLDQLVQREAARRQRRLAYIASGAVAVAAVTLLLAFYALRQRDEARAQRELADSSLDFLIGTFSIANPATENPRTITAITILDRVSKRAGGSELKAKPEVRARLLGATGDIYYNLGLAKESERDLRAALKLVPAHGGARGGILLKLASLEIKRDDSQGTAALVNEAERTFDTGDVQAPYLNARIAEIRGLLAWLATRYSLAVPQYERAAELYAAAPGDHRGDIGRVWMNEGNALVKGRNFQRADETFAKAEALYMAVYGREHFLSATATQNRAYGAFEAGRFPEADELARKALTIDARVLDPDHPTVGDLYVLLGRVRHARGDFAGASEALARALAIFTRIYGPDNAAVGDAAIYSARVWSDRGSFAKALEALKVVKRTYDHTYGANDPDQVELLTTRAQVLRAAGRVAEARRDCDAALILKARLDPRDPELSVARVRCAALLADPPKISLQFHN